jgi:hypothetical protein
VAVARSKADFGASVKYGITSTTTLDATINPDFSQVESDAFEVEVNNRFPIFFSEKRPFFMEASAVQSGRHGGDGTMRTAVTPGASSIRPPASSSPARRGPTRGAPWWRPDASVG